MIPNDPTKPVILYARKKEEFPDLQGFANNVVKNIKMHADANAIIISRTESVPGLTFDLSDGTMKIEDSDIDLQPPYVFKSPFVNEAKGACTVVLEKGQRTLTLDFCNK
jgi:hypothetical protein